MRRLIIIITIVTALILPPVVNSGCRRTSSTEEILDEVVDWVVATRGLSLSAEIDYRFISSDELSQTLLDDFEGENTEEELTTNKELLALLGLLEDDADLHTILLDLLTEQVAGYYDYKTKELYIISDRADITVVDRITFAHEVTHALQDQHYDLQSLIEQSKDDSEHSAAMKSLIEGDATLVDTLYFQSLSSRDQQNVLDEYDRIDSEKYDAAPRYLQESLVFPYNYGSLFTLDLYMMGGWDAVDNAYSNQPKSMEQIMHPSKYTSNDNPVVVDLPDIDKLLDGSWVMKDQGSVGEFDLRLTLEAFITPSQSTEIATDGWGGDKYAYLKDSAANKLLVIYSEWDTEADAQEFFDLYSDNRAGTDINDNTWTLSVNESNQKVWAADVLVTHLEISENEVLLIIAPDVTTVDLISDAILP